RAIPQIAEPIRIPVPAGVCFPSATLAFQPARALDRSLPRGHPELYGVRDGRALRDGAFDHRETRTRRDAGRTLYRVRLAVGLAVELDACAMAGKALSGTELPVLRLFSVGCIPGIRSERRQPDPVCTCRRYRAPDAVERDRGWRDSVSESIFRLVAD